MQYTNEDLKNAGIRREMVVVNLEPGGRNDLLRFVLSDPSEPDNSQTHRSNLVYLPDWIEKCRIGSFVPVYFNPENPKHYMIDTQSAYTDKEKLKSMCEGTKLMQTIENNCRITFKAKRPGSDIRLGIFIFILGLVACLFNIVTGIITTFVGFFAVLLGRNKRKLSRLVKTGTKYEANLHKIKKRIGFTDNGREYTKSHELYFLGRNPITGDEEEFIYYAHDKRIDETRIETGTVNIYVNPDKPDETFMDISSCVLKLKG